MQRRGGVSYCLSACRRGVSACSHQIPLWHELPSYCHICLSTWPSAIGRELPVALPRHPHHHLFPVLPSLYLCKLCKCRESNGDDAYSSGISLTRVASNTCEPTGPRGMPKYHGLPAPSATPTAFLTRVSRTARLDVAKAWG